MQNAELNQFVQKFVGTYGDFLGSLRDRWNDEREYEDWSDYETAIKTKISDYVVLKVLKVGVVLRYGDFRVEIRATSRAITAKAFAIKN